MSTIKPISMQLKDLPISSLAPETAIERNILTVHPETELVQAIALLLEESQTCHWPKITPSSYKNNGKKIPPSCILVVEDDRLVGLLTEWDFVRVAAREMNLEGVIVADVMNPNLITLHEADVRDIFSVLKIFRKHQIRHLPIVSESGKAVGIVTLDTIRRILKPADLLKRRKVEEVMATDVIHAEPSASVLDIVQQMVAHRVSSVVVIDKSNEGNGANSDKGLMVPIGTIAERDIVHFLALELDLEQIPAEKVMRAPLFCLHQQESVWTAHQQMQRRNLERVIICGNNGELLGIITQGSLMETLDSSQLYQVIQGLEQKVWTLQAEKVELLHNRNIELEREVNLRTAKLQEQASRERLLARIALRIRESLNLEEILNTTVSQVRQLLQTDRVIIYRFEPDWSGMVAVESVRNKHLSILGRTIKDTCFAESWVALYKKGRTKAIEDIYRAKLTQCHVEFLEQYQVRANLVVPILQGEELWGLLIAHHCTEPRKWKQSEIDFLQKLATQVAIAIKQSTLFEQAQLELDRATHAEVQLQQSKDELEIKVQERTAELKQANEQLQREIQERKHSQAELLSSQRFIQRIAETTPDILYIYDLSERRNLYENRPIAEILGYAPEQIRHMGEGVFETLLHPEDGDRVREYFQRRITLEEDDILEFEYRLKDASDRWRWFISRDTVFSRSDRGIPEQILGTASDITYRKRAEEDLHEANAKLKGWVSELEKRNQEMDLLGQMNEFLQACLSVEEAYKALSALIEPLFPGTSGAVFILDDANNVVEAVSTWGESLPTQTMFAPNECWALRRGQLHWVDRHCSGLACNHLHPDSQWAESVCVQTMAQGETMGMFYLASEEAGALTPAKRQLARTVSEHVSLALANLKLRETLHNQSIRDPLTGLYNRRYLQDSLEREIHRASRGMQTLSAIMLDVDRFKQFNDTFGHDAGDAILRALGEFVQNNIRTSDIACRYGGEELTVIMPDASLDDAYRRAEELREGVKQLQVQHRGQSLGSITISLGVACFPECGLSAEATLEAADAALYRSKSQGRDRVTLAEGDAG